MVNTLPNNSDPTADAERYAPDGLRDDAISLRQMTAFLAVAEKRSFTSAADELHMSQSGLFRAVSALEVALDQDLFVRSGRKLLLTPFAAALLPHVRKIRADYADILASVVPVQNGAVVLAGCELVLNEVVPPLLGGFAVRGKPPPALQINAFSSHEVIDKVAMGQADLGLCMQGGDNDGLAFTPILEAPTGLLVAEGMPLPRAITSLEDLARLPMARLGDAMVLPRLLRNQGVALPTYFGAAVVANTMATAFSVVRSGRYATLVSGVAAASPAAQGLRFVPLPHLLPSMRLCVVHREAFPRQELVNAVCSSVLALPWPASVLRLQPGG